MSEQLHGAVTSPEVPTQIADLEHLTEMQTPKATVNYYGSFYKERPEAEFVTATTLDAEGESEDLVLRVINERGSHNDILVHMLMQEKELAEGESPRMFVTVYDAKSADNHLFFETTDAAKDFKSPFTAPALRS